MKTSVAGFGVNQAATDLVTKLNVKPRPGPASDSLKKGGDENRGGLQKLSGTSFDRAYVDHEVTIIKPNSTPWTTRSFRVRAMQS